MTDDKEETSEARVVHHKTNGTTPRTAFDLEKITARSIAFVAWVITAGIYGYFVSEYGVQLGESTNYPYPENAFAFMAFGFALAIAFSASILMMEEDENDE